jgi:hypothetical protein
MVKAGIFPLDERGQLESDGFSVGLSQAVVRLCGYMPFAHASRLLQRLWGIAVPTSTAWEQVEREGARLQDWCEPQQQHSSPERTRWEDRDYNPRACKSISMDGGMVHIRTEGWKEFKVGCVSDIKTNWSKPEGQTVTLHHLAYPAVIGDANRFSTAMWSLAVAHQVQYAGAQCHHRRWRELDLACGC